MISVSQIAAMQLLLHNGSSASFDYYEPGAGDDTVCWGAKSIDGVTLISLRGSTVFVDWIRDLDLFADPFAHPVLGQVHPGMFLGVDQAWSDIQAHTKPPWIVSGHSLGAARSAYIAGLMTLAGKPPLARVAFGEPKPGFQQLADILTRGKFPQYVYRNGDAHFHDLVPEFPLSLPPLDYLHPSPLLEVTATPSLVDIVEFNMFGWHIMALYTTAVSRLTDPIPGT